MKALLFAVLVVFVFGAQVPKDRILDDFRVFPRPAQPYGFAKAMKDADVVAVVRIIGVDKIKGGGTFLESKPPGVYVRPLAVFRGEAESEWSILWQTRKGEKPREGKDNPVVMPEFTDYMVYLKKKSPHYYERFSADWSFHNMPAAPNVLLRDIHPAWRLVAEVAPYFSQVGEQVRYRYYGTVLGEWPFKGTSKFSPQALTLIDVKRRQQLFPKNSVKPLDVEFGLPKGATVIHEMDLTKHFDLSQPGEYWLFEGKVPLRFEVSDKVQVLK